MQYGCSQNFPVFIRIEYVQDLVLPPSGWLKLGQRFTNSGSCGGKAQVSIAFGKVTKPRCLVSGVRGEFWWATRNHFQNRELSAEKTLGLWV